MSKGRPRKNYSRLSVTLPDEAKRLAQEEAAARGVSVGELFAASLLAPPAALPLADATPQEEIVPPSSSAPVEIERSALDLSAGEPRIPDHVLAEKLGYERPRKLRETIRRMVAEGRFDNLPHCRPTVGRQLTNGGGEREYTENVYHLTEEEALLVVTQARTARAFEMTRAIVRVFREVRQGSTPAALSPAPIPAVLLDALTQQGALLERLAGVLERLSTAPASAVPPPPKQAPLPVPPLRLLPAVKDGPPERRWYTEEQVAGRLGVSLLRLWDLVRLVGHRRSQYRRGADGWEVRADLANKLWAVVNGGAR